MRLPRTETPSDGELFLIIENGIRFTGMPAFSTGDPLPSRRALHPTPTEPDRRKLAEMESLNPAPPDEIRQRMLEEQFLQGGEPSPAPGISHPHKGGHQ
jgi:hypothetical protein